MKELELFAVAWPRPSVEILRALVATCRSLGKLHPERRSRLLSTSAALAARRTLVATLAGQEVDLGPSVDRLAGLGEGSTPAGDDYLMGVLVALALHDQCERSKFIAARAAARTTTSSGKWLRAAAEGRVAGPIRNLVEALVQLQPLQPALETLMLCGGTSGFAFLEGLNEALGALATTNDG